MPGAYDAATISRFSASGHDRLRLPVPFVPITDFVDTSRPHNANDQIRLGEMKRFWKAVLGGGRPAMYDFGHSWQMALESPECAGPSIGDISASRTGQENGIECRISTRRDFRSQSRYPIPDNPKHRARFKTRKSRRKPECRTRICCVPGIGISTSRAATVALRRKKLITSWIEKEAAPHVVLDLGLIVVAASPSEIVPRAECRIGNVRSVNCYRVPSGLARS